MQIIDDVTKIIPDEIWRREFELLAKKHELGVYLDEYGINETPEEERKRLLTAEINSITRGFFVGMNHSLLNLGLRTDLTAADLNSVKCSIANLREAAYRAWERQIEPKSRPGRQRYRSGNGASPGGGQRERLRRMKQAGLIPKTLRLGA